MRMFHSKVSTLLPIIHYNSFDRTLVVSRKVIISILHLRRMIITSYKRVRSLVLVTVPNVFRKNRKNWQTLRKNRTVFKQNRKQEFIVSPKSCKFIRVLCAVPHVTSSFLPSTIPRTKNEKSSLSSLMYWSEKQTVVSARIDFIHSFSSICSDSICGYHDFVCTLSSCTVLVGCVPYDRGTSFLSEVSSIQ